MFNKIPNILMEDLRVSLGLDSDDISKDNIIFNMSKKEILNLFLKFNGFNIEDSEIDNILELNNQIEINNYCDNNYLFGMENYINLILALNQ